MPPATLHADSFGNPLTLDDAASLPLVEDFAMGFVSTEARAVNLLALADSDASPMVQAYCATLHLFAESRDAAANARPFLPRPAPQPNAPRRANGATSRPSRPGPRATSPKPSHCTRSRRGSIRATSCR